MTAARAGEKKAFFLLLGDAFRQGRPSGVDLMAHLTIWLIPWALRTRLAVALASTQPATTRWLGDPADLALEVREICSAILSSASDPRVAPLRAERGKKTFRVEIDSGSGMGRFIVKEYGPRGPLDAAILRHLRRCPGVRLPGTVQALQGTGVLTAAIRFGALAHGHDGPRQLMWMEEIEGAETLREVLWWLPPTARGRLFELVGRAVVQMHGAGVFHFDLNEDNLLFCLSKDGLAGPYFVDLDYTVRASPVRRWLCRILAKLDLHQFFTIRNAEITMSDRHMFGEGYRMAGGPMPEWRMSLEEGAAAQRKSFRGTDPPLPRRRYPRWKRRLGTSLIHLFRGALLVVRWVQ